MRCQTKNHLKDNSLEVKVNDFLKLHNIENYKYEEVPYTHNEYDKKLGEAEIPGEWKRFSSLRHSNIVNRYISSRTNLFRQKLRKEWSVPTEHGDEEMILEEMAQIWANHMKDKFLTV